MSTAPQRERFDHAKLRREKTTGFRGSTDSKSAEGRAGELRIKKPRVFEGRAAQSLQRVAQSILQKQQPLPPSPALTPGSAQAVLVGKGRFDPALLMSLIFSTAVLLCSASPQMSSGPSRVPLAEDVISAKNNQTSPLFLPNQSNFGLWRKTTRTSTQPSNSPVLPRTTHAFSQNVQNQHKNQPGCCATGLLRLLRGSWWRTELDQALVEDSPNPHACPCLAEGSCAPRRGSALWQLCPRGI